MPARNWKVRIEDILESCSRITRYTSGLDEVGFQANDIVVDAVI